MAILWGLWLTAHFMTSSLEQKTTSRTVISARWDFMTETREDWIEEIGRRKISMTWQYSKMREARQEVGSILWQVVYLWFSCQTHPHQASTFLLLTVKVTTQKKQTHQYSIRFSFNQNWRLECCFFSLYMSLSFTDTLTDINALPSCLLMHPSWSATGTVWMPLVITVVVGKL